MAVTRFVDPFFIVGCGRSGTTLLRVMLDSHDDVAVPPESLFIPDYLRSDKPAPVLRQALLREYEIREWGLAASEADLADCDDGAALIARIHELYAHSKGKKRWGQKTPRLVRHGRLLKQHFPGARFIHVVRDPRAVANSLMRSNVHRSNALYAARRWNNDVAAGLELEPVLTVAYEALVTDPEPELKRICEFLGLDYSPSMLSYTQKSVDYSAFYQDIHKKLADKPDPNRINAWRDKMDPRDIAVVESQLAVEIEPLGYERLGLEGSRSYTTWLRLQRYFGFAGQIFYYLRKRRSYLSSFVGRKRRLGLLRDLLSTRFFLQKPEHEEQRVPGHPPDACGQCEHERGRFRQVRGGHDHEHHFAHADTCGNGNDEKPDGPGQCKGPHEDGQRRLGKARDKQCVGQSDQHPG